MKNCCYKATLRISSTASDKKSAEQYLKEPIYRLKALSEAFDFSIESTYHKDTEYTEHTIQPLYVFTFRIYTVFEPDFSLNFAVMIRTFANMNAFKISDVELYLLNDE